jgi:hypothetical protein
VHQQPAAKRLTITLSFCNCCVLLQKIIYVFTPISMVVFGLAAAWVVLG